MIGQQPNPVEQWLNEVTGSEKLSEAIQWLREPPGLYIAVGVGAFVAVLVVLKIASGFGDKSRSVPGGSPGKNVKEEIRFYRKHKRWRELGDAYERAGKEKEALKAYRKAGAAGEEAHLLAKLGRRAEARQVLEAAGRWKELAELSMKGGDFAKAAEAYEKAGETITAAETWERAQERGRAANLYLKAGMETKAADLLALEGGRKAAEVLESELRRVIARQGAGAALDPQSLKRLKRCMDLWIAEGDADRAFRIGKEAAQWKMLVPVATEHVRPSEEAADACVRAGAMLEAAGIYDKLGDPKQAAALRAQHHQGREELLDAAHQWEVAEDWMAAADLYASMGKVEQAAPLYEKGGDPRQAAEAYAATGNYGKAATLYEQVGDAELAAQCWEQAGEDLKRAESLQLAGDCLGAAKILYERGLFDKAISTLQGIAPESADYRASRGLLGSLFLEKGDKASARVALERATERTEVSSENVEAWYNLAKLDESEGDHDRALDLFRRINAEQYNYRDVSVRIRALQEGRSVAGSRSRTVASVAGSNVDPNARTQATAVATGGAAAAAGIPGAGDRYELRGELGRGGMGQVYRAFDHTLGREVAYKALPEELKDHPKAAEALLGEARAAAQLSHPNIVAVYDAGRDERGYFIVMELVEGQTFDKILRDKRISIPGVVNIGRQICQALDHAHSRRIVHRDLKPSNLIWATDKRVKLMDFGLARAYDDAVGNVQTRAAGTPYYMAPEQIRGEPVSPRTDLYALGCVLFELLCNRPPFSSGDLGYHHVHSEVPAPMSVRQDIPEPINQLVLSLLRKDPAERPASAKDVDQKLASMSG